MAGSEAVNRRAVLQLSIGGFALAVLPFASEHALADSGLKSLLGQASDGALDKLAEPGAFFADKAVRLLLPGPLKQATQILRFTSKAGLTGDLQRSMNDAAGLAAKEAKPVFRAAIDEMTLADGVGILTNGQTGGTDYLRKTSGVVLGDKLRPMMYEALGDVGAFTQLDRLGSVSSISRLAGLDLSHDGLTNSARDQALNGIFTYIGREESSFRSNPLGKTGGLFKGLF